MKIYQVGGSIRDKLLGLKEKEKDWVVVGSSSEELISKGYKQVGKSFPVFLHPKTNEEYALARTEKKTSLGHKGFEFDINKNVTLEDDLKRRDLTINAIAMNSNGDLIDPFGGIEDINRRIMKHVSDAFEEDPLRVFRVARFYAKLKDLDFKIDDSTILVMDNIVKSGEIESLSKERLWNELSISFTYSNPSAFFEVLEITGFFEKYFPGQINEELIKRKIEFFREIGIADDDVIVLLDLPVDFIDMFGFPKKLTESYFIFRDCVTRFLDLDLTNSEIIYSFITSIDSIRRPERLENFIRQVGAFTNFHSMDKAHQISIFLKIHGLLLDKDSKPKIKDGLNAKEAKIAAKSHYIELIKHVL
ncbi:MAG: polynucleotide adenylyltransferase [Gammaproteobacteria bacterium]|nr:polynucleotide adenylyltransferase [Gammaproteobacteria bacterium]